MIVLKRRTRLLTVVSLLLAGTRISSATPALLVDADTGAVLHQEEATSPWYPASLSKLLTAYVALKAIKDGRISADQPLLVTPRAAKMSPSKMGFRPGTIVTLDNALKMLLVRSANDMAVTIAEGIGGSVEGFADQMNAAAQSIGMRDSHFVNPNGLPDPRQVSSARDMAVLARALLTEFPDRQGTALFGIGALKLGNQIILTHNGLLGRYDGANGMKTGFTCAAGFNLVASATRGNRRLISVVLGSSTVRGRNQRVANLLDAGFNGTDTGTEKLESLPVTGGEPPDRHEETCTRHKHDESEETAVAPPAPPPGQPVQAPSLLGGLTATTEQQPATAATATANLLSTGPVQYDPVPVYIGPAPGWTGPIPAGGRISSDPATAYAAPQARGAAAAAAGAVAARGRARVRSLRSGRPARQAAAVVRGKRAPAAARKKADKSADK